MDEPITPKDVLAQVAQAIPEALPGTADTPDALLAVVRLQPPHRSPWFLELLGAPASVVPPPHANGKSSNRLQTRGGHFALPSFAYLGLAQFQPTVSEFGIRIALPEMMALANLLHHTVIGEAVMSQPFAGRSIKRANKDLGRVVAMAFLVDQQNEDALEGWMTTWRNALMELAPSDVDRLLALAPSGLTALLGSAADIEQALHSVNYGLLSATPLSPTQFAIALRRLLQALG